MNEANQNDVQYFNDEYQTIIHSNAYFTNQIKQHLNILICMGNIYYRRAPLFIVVVVRLYIILILLISSLIS